MQLMQAPMPSPPRPQRLLVYPSFGERRSISHHPTNFILDLGLARPGAHSVPYPSPPMSHSPPPPPLSPKQDPSHLHHHPAPFPPMSEHNPSTRLPDPSPPVRIPFIPPPTYLPIIPRRSKSHVASACVNCKKAHLACDVRRPCPRCVGLGKQDTCKDVQHKKRGRPRLRDERTHSFEVSEMGAVQPQPPDIMSPLSSPTTVTRPFRTGPHRILKSQPTESQQRYHRRPSLTPREEILGQSENNYFDERPPLPRTRGLHLPLPVLNATAYLTTELVVAKSTEAVSDLLGYAEHELTRVRSLYDMVMSSDRDKLYRLSRRIQEEVSERDPNYRPPPSQDDLYSAIQSVSPADVPAAVTGSKDIQENLHLRRPDGQYLRTRIQINLAKTHVFFVVVSFSLVTGIPPPLRFDARPSSFAASRSALYTTGQQPPLTSPPFLTPRQLQGEPSGPQSPYSLRNYALTPVPVGIKEKDLQLPPLKLGGMDGVSGGDNGGLQLQMQQQQQPRRERIGVREMVE